MAVYVIIAAVSFFIAGIARIEVRDRMGGDKAGKIWLWVFYCSLWVNYAFLTRMLEEILRMIQA